MPTYTGTFCFPAEDPIYADHFPGHPVVPGSLIVHAFVTAISKLPGTCEVIKMENFRFKRFVSPGTYAYRLERSPGDIDRPLWRCSLLDGNQVVVSGAVA